MLLCPAWGQCWSPECLQAGQGFPGPGDKLETSGALHPASLKGERTGSVSYQTALLLHLPKSCQPFLARKKFYLPGSQRINSALWHLRVLVGSNRYEVNASDTWLRGSSARSLHLYLSCRHNCSACKQHGCCKCGLRFMQVLGEKCPLPQR